VIAMVANGKLCRAPAVRQLDWENANPLKPVACAVDAPGIASPGECVAFVPGNAAPDDVPVPCNGRRPVFKLTGRVADSDRCSRWSNTWWYTQPLEALPHVKFNCYRKLG
jgi:hypothetical protein